MDWNTFARARWFQSSDTSWVLKQPVKDGSAVLAEVWFERNAYIWQAGRTQDWHPGKRGAMAAAKYRAWCNVGQITKPPPDPALITRAALFVAPITQE